MDKEKWLLKEIDSWQQLALIDAGTAAALRERYAQKKSANTMVLMFSVIGALLIGAGIILILARNWDSFPVPLRVSLAFFPLVTSQALAIYTVKYKYESPAWREAAAIFVTSSVFAAIAVVGQVFHLNGDFGNYVLTCGLLSLPMLFILDAASPLIVYYWTVLNWGALESTPLNAWIMFALFAAGALFVYMRKDEGSPRLGYLSWITVISGFALVQIMGTKLGTSLLLASLCYFTLVLSIDELPEAFHPSFLGVGITGALITSGILTYERMWLYWLIPIKIESCVLIGLMLIAASFFASKIYKKDKLKFLFITLLLILCVIRLIWSTNGIIGTSYAFILMCLSNAVLFAIGVGFTVEGVKSKIMLKTNIGMVTICGLVVMRFFDLNMSFLWRGIVFLLLGTAFLLVNARLMRTNRRLITEDELIL